MLPIKVVSADHTLKITLATGNTNKSVAIKKTDKTINQP